ncbi:hypothetical protein P0D88_48425 [Paraburkholderia sp. RL18-103-BIB-C]|uniref:hypothetical protein n=1 Tax=Paraburkholderia sp. RL18-103-BIB-C TaxID=3031637 RepID=UPI0038BD5F72
MTINVSSRSPTDEHSEMPVEDVLPFSAKKGPDVMKGAGDRVRQHQHEQAPVSEIAD